MDFYLNNCDTLDIRGELKTDLHLLDVGKLDSLQAAEDFIANFRSIEAPRRDRYS